MKEKPGMVQSTIRTEDELLREAQYYLSLERTNVTKFFNEKLRQFVTDYRHKHPERVPRGVNALHESSKN